MREKRRLADSESAVTEFDDDSHKRAKADVVATPAKEEPVAVVPEQDSAPARRPQRAAAARAQALTAATINLPEPTAGGFDHESDDDEEEVAEEDEDDDEEESEEEESENEPEPEEEAEEEEESEADSEDDGEFHPNDGYESDLMGDDADRELLNKMSGVEREEVLFNRSEARRQARERWEALREHKAQQQAGKARAEKEKKSKKRKAAKEKKDSKAKKAAAKKEKKKAKKAEKEKRKSKKKSTPAPADEDMSDVEKPQLKSQARKQSAAEAALAEMKALRQGKSVARSDDSDTDADMSDASKSLDEPEESSNERVSTVDALKSFRSDVKRQFPNEQDSVLEFIPPLPHKDLNLKAAASVAMRRADIESLVDEPFLDPYLKGAFVRINVNRSDSGKPVYRMAEVVGLDSQQSSRAYTLMTSAGAQRACKLQLRLKIGSSEKGGFPINMISNSPLTEDEFTRWLKVMNGGDANSVAVPVPSCELVQARRRAADKLRRTFVYTSEVIAQQLAKRRLLSVLDLPDLRRNLECALEDESTALAKNDTQAVALAQEQAAKYRQQIAEVENDLLSKNQSSSEVAVVAESAEQQRANFMVAKQRHQQVAAEEAAFARAPTRPAPIWSAKPGESSENKGAAAKPAVKTQKAAAWDAEVALSALTDETNTSAVSESSASLADRMLKELQQRHQGASKYGDLEFPLTAKCYSRPISTVWHRAPNSKIVSLDEYRSSHRGF